MHHQLTILSTAIRTDYEGRYCLNDLHRAAGGEEKHKPPNFFQLKSTDGLIDALLESQNCSTVPLRVANGGSNPGTFVCKELVYAYAMWISPRFHLQVIRAYDQMVTQQQPQAPALKAPGTLREALLLALAQEEQIEALNTAKVALEASAAVTAPKVAVYERVVADKVMVVTAFARMLPGVNSMQTLRDLERMNYLWKPVGGSYRVRSQHRDVLFHESISSEFGNRAIELLPAGKELLTHLYRTGLLTMRQGCTPAA
jgi:hypothetical protein